MSHTNGTLPETTEEMVDRLYAWFPPPLPATPPLPEARSSVNVHVMVAGRDCLLTLRDHDEGRLLARLEAVLTQYPLEGPRMPQDGFCSTHGVPMQPQEKNGQRWWSHYDQASEKWCKGHTGR
jgi:hypothetical protein